MSSFRTARSASSWCGAGVKWTTLASQGASSSPISSQPRSSGTDTPAAQTFHETYVDRYFPGGTTSQSGADKVTGRAAYTGFGSTICDGSLRAGFDASVP